MIVDDSRLMRDLLSAYMLHEGYRTITAASGGEAMDRVLEYQPDLILLDVIMPDIDGFQVTRYLKNNPMTYNIPIILVTGLNSQADRLTGLQAGAEDFISKPIDPNELLVRCRNMLRLKVYGDSLLEYNHGLAQQVEEKTLELRTNFIETVTTLMRAAEYRDEATGLHVNRISKYSALVAEHMGMDRAFCEQIFYASPMHDIGKLAIPDRILLKNAGLSKNEWRIMRTHTTLGVKILEGAHSPFLEMGKDIALCHHECWDGSGYPSGLRGEQIPLSARIMTVCDVYDALRSKRPYKEPMTHEQAVAVILHGDERISPEKFDPAVLATFAATGDRFAVIYDDSDLTAE